MKKIAQQRKVLYITRGPSGSGKSTLVKELSKRLGVEALASDDYFMRDGQYVFDITQLEKAHRWNQDRAATMMNNGVPSVIIDNTNTRFWEMKPYIELANQFGYEVEFVEPNWHDDLKINGKWNVEFLDQMQGNPDRTSVGKRVPRHVLEFMVDRYEYDPSVEKILQSERPQRI